MTDELETFRAIVDAGNLEITSYTGGDPDGKPGYKMLQLDAKQRTQIEMLTGKLAGLMAAGTMASAYTVKFPQGIQGHLMAYNDGSGVGSPIQGADGKIVDHAAFRQMTTQAAMIGAFNVMAMVSGQYFLSEINGKLDKISISIDKILEFLYGDKRAELLSEVSFTKYAYENYISIMAHEIQRTATISGLQAARKVAIKDIEFYISDLESVTNGKDTADISAVVDTAFQVKKSLELSIQLYVMTTILEMYYAENYDPSYINYIENEMKAYIDKCDKWILSDFSKLNAHVLTFKDKLLAKPIDKQKLSNRIAAEIEIRAGGESELQKSLRVALQAPIKNAEYCIAKDGIVYLRIA